MVDKKWNKWFIILGIILLILSPLLGGLFSTILPAFFILPIIAAGFLIIFGIVNYKNWRTWVKVLVSIVAGIIVYLLYILVIVLFVGG